MTSDPPSSLPPDSTDPAVTDGVDGSTGAVDAASPQERLAALAAERPEAAVGAAFAGGLLLALILKRLAR
ncbi:MAG TPA: hypothetical protein VIH85_24735 [Solirubrobacteraceae bacterium]